MSGSYPYDLTSLSSLPLSLLMLLQLRVMTSNSLTIILVITTVTVTTVNKICTALLPRSWLEEWHHAKGLAVIQEQPS